jgi:hypothetical protein
MRRFRRTDDIRAGRLETTLSTLQSLAVGERENVVGGVVGDEQSELAKVSRWVSGKLG